jgi:hypothetical protein
VVITNACHRSDRSAESPVEKRSGEESTMRPAHRAAIIGFVWIAFAACGGGGGGGGDKGPTQTCTAGQVSCDGSCIDPLMDENHCGASGTCTGADAGTACASDHFCNQGSCACSSSQVECGGDCIDPRSDEGHCGASGTCTGTSAGTACASDHFCNQGSCACSGSEVECGGACVDPQSSNLHCGAGPGCTGGTACAAGKYCFHGGCVVECTAGVVCGESCIDPNTSSAHCGASGDCLGANAGVACASDHACSTGICVCSVSGQVDCGGTCIDPLTDEQHCGASGTCSGSQSGTACASGQTCLQGTCEPRLDWTPTTSLTTPPRFPDGPTTILHLIYEGGSLVDTVGNTTWTAVASPAETAVGMWSPTQYYTGPFAVADPQPHWVGDSAAKTALDGLPSTFLVCVRFKPGAHPTDTNPSKVVIADGKPENAFGTANGGWALVQKYMGYFFLYQDAAGVTMVGNGFSGSVSIGDAEWAYFCAGRDGTAVHSLNEGRLQNETGMFDEDWNSVTAVGALHASADAPTVGSYADGSHSLVDGGVYEIIVTSDRATSGNALNLIAGASGGVITDWTGLATVTGADGTEHLGAPSTIAFQPSGSVATDHAISWGPVLPPSPPANGTCFGMQASAADWTTLPNNLVALRWANASGSSQLHWINTGSDPGSRQHGVEDHFAGPPELSAAACANPGSLAAGSHTFMVCHGTDLKGRAYVDGTLFAEMASAEDPSLIPNLADPSSTFTMGPIGSGVTVSRVFACGTADPAVCH